MGTSSIYKGPKKTILLPDDYSEDNDLNDVSNFPSDEEANEQQALSLAMPTVSQAVA